MFKVIIMSNPQEKSSQKPQSAIDKIKVLFVCLGNICRSPAAEGIMKRIVAKNNLENEIEVDSAGTSGWHQGELPDARMRMHGEKRGYDFNSCSRKISSADLQEFDYIIVMDKNNYKNVKSLAVTNEDVNKIHLMTDFSLQMTTHKHVPDPYYGGEDGFELVMDLLEDACEGLLQTIIKEHGLN